MNKGDAAEHAEHNMKDNRWVPGWMCAPHPQTDATERTDNLVHEIQCFFFCFPLLFQYISFLHMLQADGDHFFHRAVINKSSVLVAI